MDCPSPPAASAPRRSSRTRRLAAVLICVTVTGCDTPRPKTVLVSGKTAYAGMGVEEVRLAALPLDTPDGAQAVYGKSGYHGSFLLRLRPGNYRIEGRGGLTRRGEPDRVLTGHVTIEVPAGASRVDRIMLEMREDR